MTPTDVTTDTTTEENKGKNRKKAAPALTQKPGIFLRGQETFRSDTFRAELSHFLKNTQAHLGKVSLEKVPHVHYFHSYDSNGKKMLRTESVGGHFHYVTLEVDPKTGAVTAKCGPAMYVRKEKIKGRGERKVEGKRMFQMGPEDDFKVLEDTHTHEMTYMGSEYMRPRRANQPGVLTPDEAAKAMAAELGMEGL